MCWIFHIAGAALEQRCIFSSHRLTSLIARHRISSMGASPSKVRLRIRMIDEQKQAEATQNSSPFACLAGAESPG